MTLLDWRHPAHYDHAGYVKPCRHCGDLTPLRDETRRPAHKVCAERAIDASAAQAAAIYRRASA